jgi:hypothetical protein
VIATGANRRYRESERERERERETVKGKNRMVSHTAVDSTSVRVVEPRQGRSGGRYMRSDEATQKLSFMSSDRVSTGQSWLTIDLLCIAIVDAFGPIADQFANLI